MDSWDAIRSLDEEENWVERNRVLSKTDHLVLIEYAKEMMEELIQNLPIPLIPSNSDANYTEQFTDDDFKYSSAQFDTDYLENLSSEANTDPSSLSRKSLFVKFDPLVSGQLPKGKEPPKKATFITNAIPRSEGDLLLLSTPPRSVPNIETKTNPSISQLSFLSPVTTQTDTSRAASQPSTDVPETTNLVNVLKYSEDDLPQILQAARQLQRDAETAKYEEQIKILKEKIARTWQQLQKDNKRKENFQAKTVLQNSASDKVEQDLNSYREKLKSHVKREQDLETKHEELKKDVSDLKEQLELITRDSTSLENSFDDLHNQYVKLKAVHQLLTDKNKIVQQYMIDLKAWTHQDTENTETIQRELHVLQQRAEEAFEGLHKEHASRMTIERAKALKLKMQQDNLEKAYKQKEEEKQQVSQICDELMRELEAMQKIG